MITLSDEYSDNSLKDNPLDDSMMNLLTDSPYITDVKSIKKDVPQTFYFQIKRTVLVP